MARRDLVSQRVHTLISQFDRYVTTFDTQVPFSPVQLALHRATLELRRNAGSVSAAVADPEFVASLRQTLVAWRLAERASRLADEPAFEEALRTALPELVALETFRIDADVPDDISERLWAVVVALRVADNQAKIVAGTKTLHHLLPDLVPPMDRAWTGKFFGLHGREWQGEDQRRTFLWLYRTLSDVARKTQPQRYVTGEDWRTSRTKIIDNAVVAYCITELDTANRADADVRLISFWVPGYPPAKNEAMSMLGPGHSHAERVHKLLKSARDALQAHATFTPIHEGPVALEVVLHASPQHDSWDATNYLGGIADVLEDKCRRGAIAHLGDLAQVWLYGNDRQIKQVSYREQTGSSPGYVVTVRAL